MKCYFSKCVVTIHLFRHRYYISLLYVQITIKNWHLDSFLLIHYFENKFSLLRSRPFKSSDSERFEIIHEGSQ